MIAISYLHADILYHVHVHVATKELALKELHKYHNLWKVEIKSLKYVDDSCKTCDQWSHIEKYRGHCCLTDTITQNTDTCKEWRK